MSIDVERLSFSYGAHPVLRDVSFTLGDGEFLSVIGPSGAGKTTLFRILNGTLPCDGGEGPFQNCANYIAREESQRRAPHRLHGLAEGCSGSSQPKGLGPAAGMDGSS